MVRPESRGLKIQLAAAHDNPYGLKTGVRNCLKGLTLWRDGEKQMELE